MNQQPRPASGPLSGIRVVEFGQFIAVPGATMLLADMGADVVKVESLKGDSARHSTTGGIQSPMYVAYNRNKRSISIDLGSDSGREIARKLALSADVVIQNARAGVLERAGLGADTLRAVKPELIYASVSGFGTKGPSRTRPGLDIAAQAESGMMSLTGEPGGNPLKVGFAVVDAATALALTGAISAALFRRERSGEGETIDTSLLEVAVQLQTQIWSEYQYSGRLPPRVGNSQPMAAPAADLIAVQDGHVVISAYLQDHWRRLCTAIGRGDLIDDPRFATNVERLANRPALVTELHGALGTMTGEAARQLLESHGVVVGVVRNYDQVMQSADIAASGIFSPVDDGNQRQIRLPGMPFHLQSMDATAASA
nr:CoA transferase [Pseudomonas sp.]